MSHECMREIKVSTERCKKVYGEELINTVRNSISWNQGQPAIKKSEKILERDY